MSNESSDALPSNLKTEILKSHYETLTLVFYQTIEIVQQHLGSFKNYKGWISK